MIWLSCHRYKPVILEIIIKIVFSKWCEIHIVSPFLTGSFQLEWHGCLDWSDISVGADKNISRSNPAKRGHNLLPTLTHSNWLRDIQLFFFLWIHSWQGSPEVYRKQAALILPPKTNIYTARLFRSWLLEIKLEELKYLNHVL